MSQSGVDPIFMQSVADSASLAREIARRLREGQNDPKTLQVAAEALENLSTLYEKQTAVLDKAMKSIGGC